MADELKVWVAVRMDLGMSLGKVIVQAGHGFMGLFGQTPMGAEGAEMAAYMDSGSCPKIAVEVSSERMLRRVHQEAVDAGIYSYLVVDAGRTEIEPGTATVCVFGPALRTELPAYLKRLQLL